MTLVMQGLKFQKCSPGFLDARNAILKADSILYGSKYRCAIWNAFARRGMGYSALQGSAAKTTDQTPAYDMAPLLAAPTIITSSTTVNTGQNGVAYSCATLTGARKYNWYYSGSGITINNNGKANITIDFSINATSGTLYFTATNATGCEGSFDSISITVIPVPVKLSSFTAEKVNTTTLLQWSTATEINSKNFEVQRSADGKEFKTIGVVQAKGNSTNQTNYSFTDAVPINGINYYRLKQVDVNGKFEYTNIIQVNFKA